MTTGRTRLGTFGVARYTADPDRDFERVLHWVASVVALAIEHTTQVESLEQLGRQLAEERDRAHGAMSQLGERVKELTALHRTARLLEDEQLTVAGLLEQIAALLPPAFQFPEIAQASVSYGDTILRTPGFVDTPWTMSAGFQTRDGVRGDLRVAYWKRDRHQPRVRS
jgi:hypothetical protein